MATLQTIDAKGLHKLMEQKPDLCLIDVRTPAEYETVHAAGASPRRSANSIPNRSKAPPAPSTSSAKVAFALARLPSSS